MVEASIAIFFSLPPSTIRLLGHSEKQDCGIIPQQQTKSLYGPDAFNNSPFILLTSQLVSNKRRMRTSTSRRWIITESSTPSKHYFTTYDPPRLILDEITRGTVQMRIMRDTAKHVHRTSRKRSPRSEPSFDPTTESSEPRVRSIINIQHRMLWVPMGIFKVSLSSSACFWFRIRDCVLPSPIQLQG